MLWQGAPRWQDLALHAFHARKVIWYFIGLAVLQGAVRLSHGADLAAAARPALWALAPGLTAAAILALLAYASARTTVYTITSRRLVMRVGMAISVTINIPFRQIDGASVRLFGNGSGDIPLKITPKERIAYLMLWPHARPFHFTHPQPCLRAIPDADRVAGVLAEALSGSAGQAAAAVKAEPARLSLNPWPREDTMSNATHVAPFPRLPLMAAIACVLASLLVVAGARLAGLSPSQHIEGAEVLDTRLLRFADAANGSVEVFDGATGKLITTAAPGTNGFLRGSLRGLMR